MRIFLLAVFSLLLVSCSSEKSDLYTQATEAVKERLKAPSTASFADYDEKSVVIVDTAGTGNPIKEATEGLDKSTETHEAITKFDDTPYSLAKVSVDYEAQNALGVPLKGKAAVYFQKWHHKDGTSSEWKLAGVESEK